VHLIADPQDTPCGSKSISNEVSLTVHAVPSHDAVPENEKGPALPTAMQNDGETQETPVSSPAAPEPGGIDQLAPFHISINMREPLELSGL
jgi:hypothetical protein